MGKKDKQNKRKDKDFRNGTIGRNHWLKAGYGEEGDSSVNSSDGRRRKTAVKARRNRQSDEAILKNGKEEVTIDMLEQADRRRRAKATGPLLAETVDRHACYMESVQFPSAEVRNLVNIYTELRPESTSQSRHRPTILREDFCGTGILCREWCKGGVEREAWGVDLDPTVIKYAKERTLGLDGGPECERVKVVLGNVLDDRKTLGVPRADIIAALNYGVNFFKKRADLMAYLKNSRENLAEGGTLIVDLFGGATVNGTGGRLFERRYDGFTYFFEQKPFDLMTNTSRVHLHFRFDDGSWMKNAYTYDFRAYSIVEIREAMLEAGFASTHVWIAASTDEKEAEGYVNDDDDEEDAEEDDEESEQQDDSEDGSEEDERPTARRRKQVTSGSPNEGAYAYSRVVGSLNQLQSYNAYVIGII